MDSRGALVMGMSAEEFVQTIQRRNMMGSEVSECIRAALTDLLGEISAAASLAYVGDAANGDIKGFARRTDELFGSSAGLIFSHILVMADKVRSTA
ncbi:MAG: hypothetical protein JRN09_08770 [Nitrososphaerota archaeon]|jgi:hypothetical protein|nr:hypothetical protein [Nitrososphaerota archaeon]